MEGPELDRPSDGTLEETKIRGPTLLKDIWKFLPGKIVVLLFNSRNKTIGKYDRKLASFIGIIVRTPELMSLHINDWRGFDKGETNKLVEYVKDMINENLSNSRGSNEQPPRPIAWEGDVYFQLLGNEKTGYVRGLGLGATPSAL
ncbi:hypothetical protein HAX54_023346 [Datura stramonium]|uniref:Uncharacterized protein n=1 Tax=Datura stramonium TaxID=4076 RepID=A0ABS8UXA1_DATST|nr:hypothetical protein [Datura stramonium]